MTAPSVPWLSDEAGRRVPFEKARVADAVARAQATANEKDGTLGGEVADLVELALARRFSAANAREESAAPTIDDVEDLIERALIDLGRAAVAKAYILERDRRARVNAALQVRAPASTSTPGDLASGPRPPRVEVQTGLSSWSRARIVAALLNEADLPRATAEDVARRVEARVFDSGLRRISTALIRELVDNELLEMGLAHALRRQRPVGLPRHDLRQLLRDPDWAAGGDARASRRSASDTVAGEILRRYALEDVVPAETAQLCQSGELWIEGLDHPHRPIACAVPCEFWLRKGAPASAAFEMLDEIAAQARDGAQSLALEDAGLVFQSLKTAVSRRAWLAAVRALTHATGLSLDFVHAPRAGAESAPTWLAGVLEEWADLARRDPHPPRLFLDREEITRLASDVQLASLLEAALERGAVVPTWNSQGSGDDGRFAGPGLTRGARETGALTLCSAVSINVVRIARHAGPWREDLVLEGLARAVETALDAAIALSDLQREHRALREPAGRPLYARRSAAIVPVGLREALRILGDGDLRPQSCGRVLSFLGEAVQRFGKRRGMPASVSPFGGTFAAARFARLDRAHFPWTQPLLFEGDASASDGPGAPYGCGFDLGLDARRGAGGSALEACEAALLAAQPVGALHPHGILAGAPRGGALARFERLDRLRVRLRAGRAPLYVLPSAGALATSPRREAPLPYDAASVDPSAALPARTPHL
ncbi:MAG: ATP cone domain-containing protein [Planctomycetota bacterium]